MKRSKRAKLWIVISLVIAVIALVLVLLPSILQWLGLHPEYKGESVSAAGRKALIITTSTGTLGEDGPETGVYSSELTIPYYVFEDAGMAVDIASIEGGTIPIEPMSIRYPLITAEDRRAQKDAAFQEKVRDSIFLSDVSVDSYDLIYLAGGWGAAYDFAQSATLGQKITEANERGMILGSVCHGALGFLQAKETDGRPLVEGKRMTAVTNKQILELGITQLPLHPEEELRNAGTLFESNAAFRDILATHVVADGHIVTGQNQNSSAEAAHRMLQLLVGSQ